MGSDERASMAPARPLSPSPPLQGAIVNRQLAWALLVKAQDLRTGKVDDWNGQSIESGAAQE